MNERTQIVDIIERRWPSFIPRELVEQIADEILEDISIPTLRDKFAGQTLAGFILAYPAMIPETAARDAYRYADAMLAERQKGYSHG